MLIFIASDKSLALQKGFPDWERRIEYVGISSPEVEERPNVFDTRETFILKMHNPEIS